MRDKAELYAALFEHVSFLETSFREFDAGQLHEAKRIANSIYTILFDKGRTQSILTQLGLKTELALVASGSEYIPPNDPQKARFQTPGLLSISTSRENGFKYVPRLGSSPLKHRMMGFEQWWNEDPIYWYQDRTSDR